MRISPKQFFDRVWHDAAFRSAVFAFVLTRALVLGALLLVTNAHREGPGPAFGGPVEEVTVSLRETGTIHRLTQAIEAADGIWYLNIARNGYEQEPFNLNNQHNWAFFPLFPLLAGGAARLTGEFPLTAALL